MLKAAVDTASTQYEEQLIDNFVLGNPHGLYFPRLSMGQLRWKKSAHWNSETYDAASIIVAADMARNSNVDLIEVVFQKACAENPNMLITGEVSAVGGIH